MSKTKYKISVVCTSATVFLYYIARFKQSVHLPRQCGYQPHEDNNILNPICDCNW